MNVMILGAAVSVMPFEGVAVEVTKTYTNTAMVVGGCVNMRYAWKAEIIMVLGFRVIFIPFDVRVRMRVIDPGVDGSELGKDFEAGDLVIKPPCQQLDQAFRSQAALIA